MATKADIKDMATKADIEKLRTETKSAIKTAVAELETRRTGKLQPLAAY